MSTAARFRSNFRSRKSVWKTAATHRLVSRVGGRGFGSASSALHLDNPNASASARQPAGAGNDFPIHVAHTRHGQRRDSFTVDLDRERISNFVDGLLSHTRTLMGTNANDDDGNDNDNSETLARHHVIAYSGGVDSSLVAALVHQNQRPGEHVRAILGLSPAVPQEQVDLAQTVADRIGISLSMIRTTEGDDEMYIANAGQACLACKTNLYSSLQAVLNHVASEDEAIRQQQQTQSASSLQMYNGTNADDLQDPTRLGLIAAQNFSVRSPLQHLSKAEVRAAAKFLGLPNWNYAAFPCLRSRLALGVPATAKHLKRIEQAERHVRSQLGHVLDETSNLRVRLLVGNRARIELDGEFLDEAQAVCWDRMFVDQLEFSSVSVQTFRSGSVATRQQKQQQTKTRESFDNAVANEEDKEAA